MNRYVPCFFKMKVFENSEILAKFCDRLDTNEETCFRISYQLLISCLEMLETRGMGLGQDLRLLSA